MKSESEIKEFIDSREVLTKYELVQFIYGERNRGELKANITRKFWEYTLATKDWKSLKKYQQLRIRIGGRPDFISKLTKISKSDKRLLEFGRYKLTQLLKDQYNITISRATAGKFIKQIRGKDA